MAELDALETWATELLRKLQPAERRRLLTHVARTLRSSNASRMQAQTDPEGNAWEPRKPPGQGLRNKRKRIRQQAKQGKPMFAKLRRASMLKATSTEGAAVVEFAARAQRIARVHHFGLDDAVQPGGPRYRYPARELLGIAPNDIQALRNALVDHLKM